MKHTEHVRMCHTAAQRVVSQLHLTTVSTEKKKEIKKEKQYNASTYKRTCPRTES